MKNEKLIAMLPLETERLVIKPTSVDDILKDLDKNRIVFNAL